ncbi:MAG TPA: response regulator [Candidatus Angelobacter sp.]
MPTVLLVENEAAILEGLRYALECSGYTVLSAKSGESAIRISQQYHGPIDVLVSDVQMHRIDGFEVAANVKAAHPTAIVILMSGSPRYIFTDQVTADEFLEKPFTHNHLLAAIARHTTIPAHIGGPRES